MTLQNREPLGRGESHLGHARSPTLTAPGTDPPGTVAERVTMEMLYRLPWRHAYPGDGRRADSCGTGMVGTPTLPLYGPSGGEECWV